MMHGCREWLRAHRGLRNAMLAALVLRFALLLAAYTLSGTRVMTQGDTASYLEPGLNLWMHGAYRDGDGLPEIDRSPGYPIFIMLTGMAWGNVLLAVSAQIVVALGSVVLIYRITRLAVADRRAAEAAAWLYAVEPISVLYSVRLMPETLFVVVLLAGVERLIRFQRSGKLPVLAASGCLFAAATYVRPVSYYLPFALAVGLAWTAGRRHGLWWKAPAVLLLSTMPWLVAWQARNWVETGYGGFSSIVEKNLYFYQSAELTAELNHISLGEQQKRLGYLDDGAYLGLHPEQRKWTQAQRLHFMHAESMRILFDHRGLYLKTHWAGVAVVAFTPCATEFLQLLSGYPAPDAMPRRIMNEGIVHSALVVAVTHPGVTAVMAGFEGILVLIYLWALMGVARVRFLNHAQFSLLGIALYFVLISGGAQAIGRYRLPAMPMVCIFAGAGLRARAGARPR